MKHLLLLSNSTMKGQAYFEWPLPHVKEFCKTHSIKRIAFVPYAAVGFSYDKYESMISKAMRLIGIEIVSIHREPDAIEEADAIAVGGGNTFALLKKLYETGHYERIQRQVEFDSKPYMGWSAGANMACPALCTSNDMPIVEPPSFRALGFISQQINPHYTAKVIEGHGGESRDLRLKEYLAANPASEVLCLPEGTLLRVEGDKMYFEGEGELTRMRHEKDFEVLASGTDVNQH